VPASGLAADPDRTAVETKHPAVKGAMLYCDKAKDQACAVTALLHFEWGQVLER
jgi:hypothetical protein